MLHYAIEISDFCTMNQESFIKDQKDAVIKENLLFDESEILKTA